MNVKCTQITGPNFFRKIEMAVSQTFYKLYGRWVVKDLSADSYKIAGSGEDEVAGWVEDANETATVAGEERMMNDSLDAEFTMPYYDGSTNVLTEAILKIIKEKLCDIYCASSSYQQADCSAIFEDEAGNDATDGVLRITGGDVANNVVYVKRVAASAVVNSVA